MPLPAAEHAVTAAGENAADFLLRQVSEAELQRFVTRTLRMLGWRMMHQRWSMGSNAGFPDVEAVHVAKGRHVFMELKREGRWPSAPRFVNGHWVDGQDGWLRDLLAVGREAYLVWPSDRQDVADLLAADAPPPQEVPLPCRDRLCDYLLEREKGGVPSSVRRTLEAQDG